MGNIIFSLTLAVSSFIFFTFSYRINSINKVVLNMPLSLVETSIPLVQEIPEPNIYLDRNILEENITYYYSRSISRFCESYTIDFYYYNQDDESICKTDFCNAVEIKIEANVFMFVSYSKRARFYIQDNSL